VARPQPYLFCLIPPERADDLLEPLREHFADDPYLEVLVERRGSEAPGHGPMGENNYRRAPVARRDLIESLPPELQDDADQLSFVQRMEPLGRRHQSTDTPALIEAIAEGDPEAASELWWRINGRVRERLLRRLGRRSDGSVRGEEEALGFILDALDGYEDDPERTFSDWLDEVVDRYAAARLAS
jgi:hypothetical protein